MVESGGPPPLPPIGVALAGSSGAVLANAIVYPLDMIKTRMQVQVRRKTPRETGEKDNEKDNGNDNDNEDEPHYTSTLDAIRKIVADQGVGGLYTGIGGSLIGVASTNFAYFYAYSVVRTLYFKSRRTQSPPSTPVELLLGAVAGAVAQIFTIPVAVITTRQQTRGKDEARKGLLDTGREIVAADGATGLWRGLKASLVLVVNPSITYGSYERLRGVFFAGRNSLRPWEAFVLGALSKALATIVTQPLIVAKVGLQSRPPPERRGKPFRSFVEVMAYIVENEGVVSLFKGMAPQLLKGLLVQGLLMTTKERIEVLFVLFFAYLRKLRSARLQKAAERLAEKTRSAMPALTK